MRPSERVLLRDIATIRPKVGLGSLRFGATRDEVRAYLSSANPVPNDHDTTWEWWAYEALALCLAFDRADGHRLVALRTERRESTLMGKRFIGMPQEAALRLASDVGLGAYASSDLVFRVAGRVRRARSRAVLLRRTLRRRLVVGVHRRSGSNLVSAATRALGPGPNPAGRRRDRGVSSARDGPGHQRMRARAAWRATRASTGASTSRSCTTGVYCRPICPVRQPKAENVRFYPSAAAAAAAGFRPCLRCRPESSPGAPVARGTGATVARALRLIDEGALDRDGVDALAGAARRRRAAPAAGSSCATWARRRSRSRRPGGYTSR